jgi:DNA-cytosine methyltransferase
MVKVSRAAKFPRVPAIIKTGTDFSGLGTLHITMDRLDGVRHESLFEADTLEASEKLLSVRKDPPKAFYNSDLNDRNLDDVPEVDLYCWTPPCQSYSRQGNQEGIKDKRGALIAVGVKYAVKKKPKALIMENVAGILSRKHKNVVAGITKALEKNGFVVFWGRLNGLHTGVPTDRDRAFCVGIRKDCYRREFHFPPPLGVADRVVLADVLDPFNDKTDKVCRMPKAKRMRKLISSACSEAKAKGIDAREVPLAVDIDCSPKFRCWGQNFAKTLTKSRGRAGGPWISTRGRRTTTDELMRIQGFLPCEIPFKKAGVSKTTMGEMLGNCVPVNMIGFLLPNVLWSAGLVSQKPKFKNRILEFQGNDGE